MDNNILSSTLPKLNGTTKDLINAGRWFLYKISYEPIPTASYCLAADKLYYLDSEGSVITSTCMTPIDLKFGDSVKFSDLPIPEAKENFLVI